MQHLKCAPRLSRELLEMGQKANGRIILLAKTENMNGFTKTIFVRHLVRDPHLVFSCYHHFLISLPLPISVKGTGVDAAVSRTSLAE